MCSEAIFSEDKLRLLFVGLGLDMNAKVVDDNTSDMKRVASLFLSQILRLKSIFVVYSAKSAGENAEIAMKF